MSIGAKVSYLVVFFSFLGMTLLGLLITVYDFNQTMVNSLDRIKTISQVTNDTVAAAMLFEDGESAHEVINSITEIQYFLAVAFVDNDGELFASTESYKDFSLPDQYGDDHYIQEKGMIFYKDHLLVDNQLVGSMILIYDLAATRINAIRFAAMCVLMIVVIIIFLAFLTKLYIRKFIWPLRYASEIAEDIAKTKNYSHRMDYQSKDELGVFVSSFNEMLNTIEFQNKELKELNSDLENRVQQRTKSLEKARIEAEQANLAKTSFLANMSHEIRTPLNGIIGLSEVALGGHTDLDSEDVLRRVNQSGKTLLHIINEILDLSKVEAGKMDIETKPFALSSLKDGLKSIHAVKAQEKALDFQIIVDPEIPQYLVGDELRIRQVLMNLIGNAIKFTDQGLVHVRITLDRKTRDEVTLLFSIKDTGIGIPPDKQKVLFDAFSQVDDSASRKYSGTGLGLAICKEIIELMHGVLKVESRPSLGSIFSFKLLLPVADKEEVIKSNQNELEQYQAEHPLDLSKIRFLIVDDHETNHLVAKSIIESAGGSVVTAFNGLECLDLLKWYSFDAILMDLQMPEMNGYETTEKIRSELGLTIPIIAISAHAFEEDKKKCLEIGMNDYVVKPIDPAVLLNTLGKFLSKPSSDEKKVEALDEQEARYEGEAFWEKVDDLNYEDALQRLSGASSIYQSLLVQFSREVPSYLAQIDQALESTDIENALSIIHKLINLLGNIGFDKTVKFCQNLESDHRYDKEWGSELETSMNELRADIQKIGKDLKSAHDTLS